MSWHAMGPMIRCIGLLMPRGRSCWQRWAGCAAGCETSSAQIGAVAVLQVVVDAQSHRGVHIQRGDVVGVAPGDVGAFVVDGQGAAEHGGGEAQRELLADFPVGECYDVMGLV